MKLFVFCRRYLLMFVVLFLTLASSSCKKEWKKTTTVNLKFDFLQQNTSSKMVFNTGFLTIHEVHFSGVRKQGDNVDFTDDLGHGSNIDFATGISSPISYDIPQGTYTNINMEFKINEKNPSSPSILLNGIYLKDDTETDSTDTNSTETGSIGNDSTGSDDSTKENSIKEIPIQFIFNSGEFFSVQATTADGSNEIVLIEDQPATVTVTFDSGYWFALITPNLLENAQLSMVNGVSTIVISKEQNQNIYDLIVPRINQTTKVIFK